MGIIIASVATSYGAFYGGSYLKQLRISNNHYEKIKRSEKLIDTFFKNILPKIHEINNKVTQNELNYIRKEAGGGHVVHKGGKAIRFFDAYLFIKAYEKFSDPNIKKKIVYASKLEEVSSKQFREFCDKSQKWVNTVEASIHDNVINRNMIKYSVKAPFLEFMKKYDIILLKNDKLREGYRGFFILKKTLKKI